MNERTHHDDVSPACERVRGRLERLLDGELSALEAARDEGHLEVCAGCGAERERWQTLLEAVRRDADDLEFALEGLDDRLAAARGPRPALRLLRGGWLPAAAVAAAGVLAMMLLRGTPVAEQSWLAARNVPAKELQEAIFTRPAWIDGFERLLGGE